MIYLIDYQLYIIVWNRRKYKWKLNSLAYLFHCDYYIHYICDIFKK